MGDLVAHPHDSVVKLTEHEIHRIIDEIDRFIGEAIHRKDLGYIMKFGDKLIRSNQASWMAMAHTVYETYTNWDVFELEDDFFEIMSVRWNRSSQTINRMLEIWTYVIEKPGHTKKRLERILEKPPGGLWLIKQAAKEGQLTEEDWKDVELAPNKEALGKIRERVRGPYRRAKDALKIMIERDGTVKARRNGPYKLVGRLNVHIEDDDIIVAAIERIKNGAGIFERGK